MDVHSGTTIGDRYVLRDHLGAGGMGQVWRATDTVLDRDVALKLVDLGGQADPTAAERFAREARATAALNSPHVVTVYDSGVAGHTAYLVMELLPGPSLADELVGGPRSMGAVEGVARDVLGGLAAAHDRGLVHRDIKPANVVRAEDGSWRIVDFGISRLIDAEGAAAPALTSTQMIVGTADYLAPEQALGQGADARSDLYAVGLLLWTLLAGHPPLSGATPVATMMRHANEDVPDIRDVRPDTPPPLAALIGALNARDPAWRPATARAALAMLNEGVAGGESGRDGGQRTEVLPQAAGATAVLPVRPAPSRPASAPPPPPTRASQPEARGWDPEQERRDRRWGPILMATIVILIVGALLWSWLSAREGGSTTQAESSTSSSASADPTGATGSTPAPASPVASTPAPSTAADSPPSTDSASQPSAGAGAAAVSAAMDAFRGAVAGAEKLGAVDKDTSKALATASREIDKAVRAGSAAGAQAAVGQLRTAYDDAVTAGSISGTASRAIGPLMEALEGAVNSWAKP